MHRAISYKTMQHAKFQPRDPNGNGPNGNVFWRQSQQQDINLVNQKSKNKISKMAETKGEPSTQTTNPLTKKLNKILETRFDNDRVRERLLRSKP